MADIVEFLRARLDEDEQVAREQIAAEDQHEPGSVLLALNPWNHGVGSPALPARVLAEVESKRRILERFEHLDRLALGQEHEGTLDSSYWDVVWCEYERNIIKPWAAQFADHPDFDESWRP